MVSGRSAEEVLASLPDEERAAVEKFRDRMLAEFGPRLRDLRIYGSKATGTAGDESDIDLLALLDGYEWRVDSRIRSIAHEIDWRLSVHVRGWAEYHAPKSRATLFYEEVRATSVKLLPPEPDGQ